jgi:hypothetical protein
LVGREGLVRDGETEDGEDGIRAADIADCENFFLVNYIDPGAISPHSTNFVIDIATAETANTY